jgi:hypothetical protein
MLPEVDTWIGVHEEIPSGRNKLKKGIRACLLMLLILSTFDVHWRDWEAVMRLMGLLRLGHKRQKMEVLRAM